MKTIILNENNVQDFVRKIMELYETKIMTDSEFISDNGKLKIKFEENIIPKIIDFEENKVEHIERVNSNNNKETYQNEISVEIKNINIGTEIFKLMCKLGYDKTVIERNLLKKSMVKLLPDNNLKEKDTIGEWDEFKFLDSEYFPTPEIYKAVSILFYSRFNLNYKEAFDLAIKSYNQKIFGYKIYSSELIIDLEKNIIFNFKNNNKKFKSLILNFLEIFEKFDNFGFISNNNIELYKRENEIFISKKTFAKTDFKALKELSIKTGFKIVYSILEDYQKFTIEKDSLKVIITNSTTKEELEKYNEIKKYFSKVNF